jgi:hypothetical protein
MFEAILWILCFFSIYALLFVKPAAFYHYNFPHSVFTNMPANRTGAARLSQDLLAEQVRGHRNPFVSGNYQASVSMDLLIYSDNELHCQVHLS